MPRPAKRPSQKDYADAAELREALRTFQSRSDEIANAQGLTSRTYQLLLMIKTGRDGERATPTELGDRLKLGKSTVTELVMRSEKRGLVRRALDPNRPGSILVRLTPAGERTLAGTLTELGNERRRLIRILSRLAA